MLRFSLLNNSLDLKNADLKNRELRNIRLPWQVHVYPVMERVWLD
jgi:hypothetical protein